VQPALDLRAAGLGLGTDFLAAARLAATIAAHALIAAKRLAAAIVAVNRGGGNSDRRWGRGNRRRGGHDLALIATTRLATTIVVVAAAVALVTALLETVLPAAQLVLDLFQARAALRATITALRLATAIVAVAGVARIGSDRRWGRGWWRHWVSACQARREQ